MFVYASLQFEWHDVLSASITSRMAHEYYWFKIIGIEEKKKWFIKTHAVSICNVSDNLMVVSNIAMYNAWTSCHKPMSYGNFISSPETYFQSGLITLINALQYAGYIVCPAEVH